ncbi:MAG: hypothetical protein E7637_01650 [Ruminococcaceae bacterium]|nr:hypothetical protein [Oscillospiraceae bacterium]
MDTSRLILILGCFALAVCLVLSITTLSSLRNAIAENESAQVEAAILISNLHGYWESVNDAVMTDESLPTNGTPTDTQEEKNTFLIRESNGTIGVFSSDGYLLRLTDVKVKTLPSQARQALAEGIVAHSWTEVDLILQDYTT